MKKSGLLTSLFAFVITISCCQNNSPANQPKQQKSDLEVGGTCEDCEAIYESPVPFDQLNETDTLPDFTEPGPKIEISGIVFKADGITPAPGIILYVYHTDQKGLYTKIGNEKSVGNKHGYIRAWLKTNEKGEYRFYTLIPAAYPNSNIPKHIHPVIKEQGKTEYWIDDFVFADDPLLSEKEKNKAQPRGGNGVLYTEMKDGLLRTNRNIQLGLHVDGYPES
jgi:protocatechuate 3,4-dioxygenase, beta subunit